MSKKAKAAAGKRAAELIESGMIVGLGSGSTAYFFIEELGKRCREGLNIQAIASSLHSENHAKQAKIPLTDLNALEKIDVDVDGADEIDPQKRMIKGGGGALFREKIIAAMSKEMIVIVDFTKQVAALGKFPLPIEISPFARQATLCHIQELGYRGDLRKTDKGELFMTDNQNFIFDIALPAPCNHPEKVERELSSIPGVIETGFFIGMAGRVIVGRDDGSAVTID